MSHIRTCFLLIEILNIPETNSFEDVEDTSISSDSAFWFLLKIFTDYENVNMSRSFKRRLKSGMVFVLFV